MTGVLKLALAHGGQLVGRYDGPDQIETLDGLRRAADFSAIKAAPTSFGDHSSTNTAFMGDQSTVRSLEHRISGPDTLGQPSANEEYRYTPEAYARHERTYIAPDAGCNLDPTTNKRRTAAVHKQIHVDHFGGGDGVGINVRVLVAGTNPGTVSYLTGPGGVAFNADVHAGAPGCLLGPCEFVLKDCGHDVAGHAFVASNHRTNATGALKAFWASFHSQSKGTQPIDVGYRLFGPHKLGLDATPAAMTGPVVALKAGQTIALNASAADERFANDYGGEFITYDAGKGEAQIKGQGATQFAVGRTANAQNYLRYVGAPAGSIPGFFTIGPDLHISAGHRTKGDGWHIFWSHDGGAIQAVFGGPNNAQNFVRLSGGVQGQPARVIVGTISDADADLSLEPKGAGKVTSTGDINVAAGKGYCVNGERIMGARGAAIANATSASVVDTVNAILAHMRASGTIAA